jgi:diaminopimelate epimerase
MKLAKAHGLGNAFLLVPAAELTRDEARATRRLCARHIGVGADGVILYALTEDGVQMRLLNADGSEAEISGNGLRCLAAYVAAKAWRPPRHVVHTAAGPKAVEVSALEASRFRVVTELGAPILSSEAIPVALEPAQPLVLDHALDVGGQQVTVTATSMGNPHCAVFCEAPADDAVLRSLGAALESHPFFPRRTNVEFVTVKDRGELRVRFWERGVGYTRSSGTGAASAAVAAILTGRADRRLRVVCDGGALDVEWPEGGSVRQIGEVELLFEGEWLAPIS